MRKQLLIVLGCILVSCTGDSGGGGSSGEEGGMPGDVAVDIALQDIATEGVVTGKEYEAKGDVSSPERFLYVNGDSTRGALITGNKLIEIETGVNPTTDPTVLALPDGSAIGLWHDLQQKFHMLSFPITAAPEKFVLEGMKVYPWTSFRRNSQNHLVLVSNADYAYDLTDRKKLELGWCNCGITVLSEDASKLYSITNDVSVMPIVDNKLGSATVITNELNSEGCLAVGLSKDSICALKTKSYDSLVKVKELTIYKVNLSTGEVTSQVLSDIPDNKRCVALSRSCNVYVAFDSKSTGLSVGNALDVAYAGFGSPSFKTVARGIFRSGTSNEHQWSSNENRCVVLE